MYMPAINQKETRLKFEFVANTDHSIHAGLVAVEAIARRFGLWENVRALKCRIWRCGPTKSIT
jgi:hypothetical protein